MPLSNRASKTDIKVDWWLFQRKQNCWLGFILEKHFTHRFQMVQNRVEKHLFNKNDNTNNLTTRTKKNTCIDKILNYQKIHWVFHVKTIKRKLKNTWTFHSTHLGRRKSLQDQAENVWKSERCFLVKKPTHHTSGNWKELIFKIKRIENWNYLIFLKAKEYFNGAWNQVKEVEWK